MKFKSIINAIALFIGLGLVACSLLDKSGQQSSTSIEPTAVEDGQKYEEWQLKPGSIYDGDTLRVIRGQEELKIRFCGIDAPEKKQKLGIESRDHLRSLVDKADGRLLLVPIEQDRYGRTVAEVYAHDRSSSAINLNLQMVRDGYAWHYEKYSANCPTGNDYAIAEELAKKEKLGVWNGNHQAPWEWRKANK